MYNKIFTKILDSSIWLEPASTRIVWITLIAAMDETGYAHFSAIENLASRARISKEETEKAVVILTSPDKNSSDPDHEGRRIERVPGGFIVLNAEKHRNIVTRIIQKERTRLRVAKHRAGKKGNAPVTDSNETVTPSEAYTETDTKIKTSSASANADTPCPHEKIINLFHAKLPELPKVRDWTPTRQSHLKARWRKYPDMEDWETFFGMVRKSDFLMGLVTKGDRKPFIATLPWLIKQENFAKVIEGNYRG